MTPLSAVIITFNEERNIERCLLSLQGVANEIIVIDSFSTDRTAEICKKYNVQFYQFTWQGYSFAKNKGQSLANSEYILSLDADECLDETLRMEIIQLKSTGFNGVYAYNRLTNYCGKWVRFSGWNPDWKVRIYPKSQCKWDDAIVHEEIEFPKALSVTKLKGRLHHFSYFSTEQHRQKADQYSRLTAKKYAEQGRKAWFFSPFLSGISRFISMYFLKLGFLDGKAGFQIAWISALSNAYKYRELRRYSANS